MSQASAVAAVAAKPASRAAASVLQRKCACSVKASELTGSCDTCSRNKALGLQRLAIGGSDDPLEHEADRAALRVMTMSVDGDGAQAPALSSLHGGHALPGAEPEPEAQPGMGHDAGMGHDFGRVQVWPGVPNSPRFSSVGTLAHVASVASVAGEASAAPASPAPRVATRSASSPTPAETATAGPAPDRPAPAAAPEPAVPPPRDEELERGGAPLDPGLRRYFEPRFGRELSEVRVHTGSRAAALNEGLNAHAFAYGSHIWLGRGHAPRADFLLAHELAHVIQQRQPPSLQAQAGVDEAAGQLSPGTRRTVRRLELGLPFWVPLGAGGMRGGSDIHAEVLGIAQANNANLDIEAPAPNANAKTWGLGLQGSIDLFHGTNASGAHARAGLFFDGPAGQQRAALTSATPKKHPRATLAAIAAGNFNPVATPGGGISGIDQGPTKVQIGELKPAAKPMLDSGEQQIENYKQGYEDAARLTNAWAAKNGLSEHWRLGSPTSLPDAAVTLKANGRDMKFVASSPRDDQNLVLATISETGIGGKYAVTVRFNPAEHGLPPIKGGLYAQLFRPGKGLWTYFARPKDLAAALRLARSALVTGEMTLANQVQAQVVDPLFMAPKKASPLRRRRRVATGDAGPGLVALNASAPSAPPLIRRAPKDPELTNDFKFADWKPKQEALRSQLTGPTATQDTKKKLASLELLDRAYEAESALDQVPGTGKTTLPPKGSDQVKIVSGSGATRKVQTRNLADMASWLKGWTGQPAEVLGLFREKFGDSFVFIANKLIAVRDKIRAKLKAVFEKHPSNPGKSSKGKIIAKALLKALLQVAKVLIPRAVHLFMDAVVAGIKKKLAAVFNIDPVKLAEDTFGAEFKEWNDKLTGFKDQADSYVEGAVSEFTKDLGWIQGVIDKAKTIGTILEAAAVVMQCGKKPGWSCLRLLSQHFRECGMEAALNICDVQKQVAGLVAVVGPLADLPATLAQAALNVVRDAAPTGLKEVLSEPVAKSGIFNNDEIECVDTPAELWCPGLFPIMQPEPGPGGEEKETQEPAAGQETQPAGPKEDAPRKEGDKGPKSGKPGETGKAGQPGEAEKGSPGQPGAGETKPPASGAEPGAGGQIADLPKPGSVHEALNDLLNEQGAEGVGALAKLAEAAGMPGDAPLTAEQVKRLQELIKKGALTPQDLKDLAGGGKPKLKGQEKPLERFLESEAHQAALDQTLEKMRQKKFEFMFKEMARLKVHWKILAPYKPGPFRNAPALMWDDTIRAVGVVDGEFGECFDGGKIALTVTRADMREEGTEKPLTVHTPFHDRDAQLAGGVCPSPPPPKGGKGAKGKGGGGGAGTGQGGAGGASGKGEGGGGGGAGTGQGGAGGASGKGQGGQAGGTPEQQGGGKAPPAPPGEGAEGGAVDSDIKPGSAGDPPGQEGEEKAPPVTKAETPGSKTFDVGVGALAGVCGLPPGCTVAPLKVDFEELGALSDGYQVMPDKAQDPDVTLSMLNPPNGQSPFSLRTAADGSQEMVMSCQGQTCVVGKVLPSSVSPGMVELVSGPLLDSLRAVLHRFLQEKRQGGNPGRVERIHFR